MGASESYNVFTGAGEILGGLLLTTRRTTLLGAIVSLGVLGHVAMLNFSYDVPVKLFSLHLLAMAVFLIAPDLRRLATMFLMIRISCSSTGDFTGSMSILLIDDADYRGKGVHPGRSYFSGRFP